MNNELDSLNELEALRAFARYMLAKKSVVFITTESIRYKAVELGILNAKVMLEPCGENCTCAERFSEYEFDQGVTCYES
jgi:hypothetical protein